MCVPFLFSRLHMCIRSAAFPWLGPRPSRLRRRWYRTMATLGHCLELAHGSVEPSLCCPPHSLDHPGRGLKHRRRPLTRGTISAALCGASLPHCGSAVERARRYSLCSRSLRPSSTRGRASQSERAATATLRVSCAECQPYPDQSTSTL